MALVSINTVCTKCGTKFEQLPVQSFLGFQKLTCPSCREKITYPLTSGYRAVYSIILILMLIFIANTFSSGGFAFPGGIGFAVMYALYKDNKISRYLYRNNTQDLSKENTIDSTKQASEPEIFSQTVNPSSTQDDYYEIVAEEIDTGKVNKGLWTKLYSQCDGDETQVKVQYIKQRVVQLAEDKRQSAQKECERKEKENEESERQRLLRLLLPSITKLIDQLEANPQKVMHTLNDDESKLQLLKEFGGKIIAANISGAYYTFEFNNKVITCKSRNEFLDCIFTVLLPFAKIAKDFPLEKLRLMEKHGITYYGGNYHFKEFKYDNFNDAISYAEIEASKLHD